MWQRMITRCGSHSICIVANASSIVIVVAAIAIVVAVVVGTIMKGSHTQSSIGLRSGGSHGQGSRRQRQSLKKYLLAC